MTLDDMIAAKREAEGWLRWQHWVAWGDFFKCEACGASEHVDPLDGCCGCGGKVNAAGYSPPPREAR